MNTNKKKSHSRELYTFTEFKKKFFPNIKNDFAEGETVANREAFLDVIKKINRKSKSPSSSQSTKKK